MRKVLLILALLVGLSAFAVSIENHKTTKNEVRNYTLSVLENYELNVKQFAFNGQIIAYTDNGFVLKLLNLSNGEITTILTANQIMAFMWKNSTTLLAFYTYDGIEWIRGEISIGSGIVISESPSEPYGVVKPHMITIRDNTNDNVYLFTNYYKQITDASIPLAMGYMVFTYDLYYKLSGFYDDDYYVCLLDRRPDSPLFVSDGNAIGYKAFYVMNYTSSTTLYQLIANASGYPSGGQLSYPMDLNGTYVVWRTTSYPYANFSVQVYNGTHTIHYNLFWNMSKTNYDNEIVEVFSGEYYRFNFTNIVVYYNKTSGVLKISKDIVLTIDSYTQWDTISTIRVSTNKPLLYNVSANITGTVYKVGNRYDIVIPPYTYANETIIEIEIILLNGEFDDGGNTRAFVESFDFYFEPVEVNYVDNIRGEMYSPYTLNINITTTRPSIITISLYNITGELIDQYNYTGMVVVYRYTLSAGIYKFNATVWHSQDEIYNYSRTFEILENASGGDSGDGDSGDGEDSGNDGGEIIEMIVELLRRYLNIIVLVIAVAVILVLARKFAK